MGEYAAKRSRTREAFLEVAFEALPGALGEGILSALGPARLARSTGLSRQTFYRHWPAAGGDFLADLVEYILAPERAFESTIIPDLEVIPEADPLTATELLRSAAIAEFETEMQLGPLLCEVVSWALLVEGLARAKAGRADPASGVRDALHRFYNDNADDLVAAYQVLLDEWGREMVPGVSVRQLAAVITGLLEGMGIRWLVDPDLAQPSLYADAVLALVPAFTRRRAGTAAGSAASFLSDDEDRVARDSEWVGSDVAASGVAESSQLRSGRRRVERSRAAVLAVARRELALRGYQATTISGVASAAGVGETTVYEHFGNKAGLAAACFESGHDEVVVALAADTSEPLTRLHNHLCRLYTLLVADRESTKALFDAGLQVAEAGPPTDREDPRPVVPLSDVMVPVVADAQLAGILTAGVDPREIADMLVGLVMLGVLMKPMDPEGACRKIESLVFDGLFTAAGREVAHGRPVAVPQRTRAPGSARA